MYRAAIAACFLLPLFLACGEPAEPESDSTAGDERSGAPDDGAGTPDEGTSAVFGLQGVGEPSAAGTTTNEAEIEAARERLEAQRRARAERCRGVAVPTQPRPALPALTPGPSLAEHERVYRESKASPPPVPSDDTMAAHQAWGEALSDWLPLRTAAIGSLQEGAAELTPPERAIAAAWVAHSYLDIVDAFTTPAPPATVAADPELRAVYRETVREQTRPLVERASQAFAYCSAHAAAPLTAHCVEMEAFTAGLACATD